MLKSQQKYGTLLAAVKQQHYERKYVPAAHVGLDRHGRVVKPMSAAPVLAGAAQGAAAPQPNVVGALAKRVHVEKGKSLREGNIVPPPPPKGWEVLFDRASGRIYYASLRGDEVCWELP